jgi:small subunit ribosomal protein S8
MTDPIADMLTRIRNANTAFIGTTTMPSSKKLVEIARILKEEGYVADYRVVPAEPQAVLEIDLKYGPKKQRTITGLRRISKPGLRVYAKKDELPRVLGGLGIAVISTSAGVMTEKKAKKAGVGGEVIAYVW